MQKILYTVIIMSGNFKKEDLRVKKTQKAFQNAIELLLNRRKFKQITVNDLCAEALTSRAAFYSHYKDKYDLLENWFCSLLDEISQTGIANITKRIIYSNTKLMQNILYEADSELMSIVRDFIHTLLDVCNKIPNSKKSGSEYIVLINFYTGGLFEMIKWQSAQKNLNDFLSTEKYFIDLLKAILDFHVNFK